jgi:Arc/MetJ-type ribon-helix-helix transcriptional regulator
MISVRLSEEEYSALQQLCTTTGARSVSDLTRDAVRELFTGANQTGAPEMAANDFRSQMKVLERKIEQLASDITNMKATGSSTEGQQ